ncbi:hypothetical protein STEG23_024668, partial [Scotinomys teguina]
MLFSLPTLELQRVVDIMIPQKSELKRFFMIRRLNERKSVLVVSFIALCLLLLAMRLVNDMNFPLLLNCFGQPETKWIPLSYTFRQPLRTHYGYINVRTQEHKQPVVYTRLYKTQKTQTEDGHGQWFQFWDVPALEVTREMRMACNASAAFCFQSTNADTERAFSSTTYSVLETEVDFSR